MSKAEGSGWEKRFDEECKFHGIDYIQLGKDKWTPVGMRAAKGVFDRILFFEDKIACLDLKCFDHIPRVLYSEIDQDQARDLLKFEAHGHKAGYLVNFTKDDLIIFFAASDLSQVSPQTSINGAHGEYFGTRGEFALGNLFTDVTGGLKLL